MGDFITVPGLIFSIVFVAVLIFGLIAVVRDSRKKKAIINSLAARPQRNDEEFAQLFLPSQLRADIAVRTRRVLSANLELPLGGITPADRLEADLNADLPLNPDLIWELEAEFKVRIDPGESDAYIKLLERLITFNDLVDSIEQAISQPASPPSRTADDFSAVHVAGRCARLLLIGGISISLVGVVTDEKIVTRFGLFLLISALLVWGIAFLRRKVLKNS